MTKKRGRNNCRRRSKFFLLIEANRPQDSSSNLMMEESDAAAVARALAGDQDGFRVLVERHSHALFRLAYRMTGNEQDAEDMVQETFLRAYRQLGRFESRANFSTWLHRIAANCSLDLLRKRKRTMLTIWWQGTGRPAEWCRAGCRSE